MRLVLFLLSVCLLSGCGKVVSVSEPAAMVEVTFRGVCTPSTRSVSVDESSVHTLDVLVFRQDGGALECHSRAIGNAASVSVMSGTAYRWYVAANAPDGSFEGVSDEDRFRTLSWRLPSLSSGTAMAGSGRGTISGGCSVSVGLDRLACRVILDTFTPDFLSRMYPDADIRLERVFLLNVNGSCLWTVTPDVSDFWYNRMQRTEEGGDVDSFVSAEHGIALSGPSAVPLGDVLYCCPNPVEQDCDALTVPQWSPRRTRLIIELSIDGVPNYYPVTLPAMQCNRSYFVASASALGPGFPSPDRCSTDRTSLEFSVSVLPWEDGGELSLDMQ